MVEPGGKAHRMRRMGSSQSNLYRPNPPMGWGDGGTPRHHTTPRTPTDARNKRRVRDFFSKSKTLPPILGGCLKQDEIPVLPPYGSCPQQQLILLSRHRDNIYICILNARDKELTMLQNIIEPLLHSAYGIKLKWDPMETQPYGGRVL